MTNIEVKVVEKKEQNVAAWAGGVTTQLAIWPPDSDYKQRNFMWRVSTARVDLEESVFTSLPGYHRLLMILEGSIHLTHKFREECRKIDLNAFDQDSFEGEWDTTSHGRCVDFNLMTAPCCVGSIEALKNPEGKYIADLFWGSLKLGEKPVQFTDAFYCLSDVIARFDEPSGSNETFEAELEQGDFLMFSTKDDASFWGTPQRTPRVSFENFSKEAVWGVRVKIIQLSM